MSYNVGHRGRVRERLLKSRPGAMEDYELLEALLFLAIPRRDTKLLAKLLIEKYGNFASVASAERESLSMIDGVTDSVVACLRLIKESAVRLAKAELKDKTILSSWNSLLDYCRALIGHSPKEMFMIFYLDSQNQLVGEDVHEYGTVNQVSVYPREVTKRALFLNAISIILAHNHPSGNTKASKSDIEITKQIAAALNPFNIKIHDHVIISSEGFFSFKSEGLL